MSRCGISPRHQFFDTAAHWAQFGQLAYTITSITVTPSNPDVDFNGTKTFSATVNGTGSPPQGVNWTAGSGSINSGGVFTPAATGAVVITATSQVDGTKTGTTTANVWYLKEALAGSGTMDGIAPTIGTHWVDNASAFSSGATVWTKFGGFTSIGGLTPDPLGSLDSDNAGSFAGVVKVAVVIPADASYLRGMRARSASRTVGWVFAVERDAGGTPYLVIYQIVAGALVSRATQNLTGTPGAGTTVILTMTPAGNLMTLSSDFDAGTCAFTSATGNTATKSGYYTYFDNAAYFGGNLGLLTNQ